MRRRAPAPAAPRVTTQHLEVLKRFGRVAGVKQGQVTTEQRNQLWMAACQTAGLHFVPFDEVLATWRDFVVGKSDHSSIVMHPDVEPRWVTLGITYHRKIVAAHTVPTEPLLKRVLTVFMRQFKDKDAFLQQMEQICNEVANPPPKKGARR